MLPLKELHLERQDREQFVHIALDVLDAIFLPRPYLWRDVIVNGTDSMCFHIFRYLQIEARVIDKNDHVRLPLRDILLTHAHIP